MQWYVIHTYSGHENKVKTNLEKAIHAAGLEDQFGQILVATEEFVEMKDGKRITSKRKTFPSLRAGRDGPERRHAARSCRTCRASRGSSAPAQDPIAAPARAEVERILGQHGDGRPAEGSAEVPFKTGEHVKVVDGPFTRLHRRGRRGQPRARQGEGHGVSIFGRATPVELDFLQVQPV